jgi:hypothetical protein
MSAPDNLSRLAGPSEQPDRAAVIVCRRDVSISYCTIVSGRPFNQQLIPSVILSSLFCQFYMAFQAAETVRNMLAKQGVCVVTLYGQRHHGVSRPRVQTTLCH